MKNTIKTFEDACQKLGISTELPNFSMLQEANKKAMESHHKLVIIAEALNDGWKPDWNNFNELKYYPWFNFSGSGFVLYGFVLACTRTAVGSRLCYKSRELAMYAGNQFEELYKEYMIFNG